MFVMNVTSYQVVLVSMPMLSITIIMFVCRLVNRPPLNDWILMQAPNQVVHHDQSFHRCTHPGAFHQAQALRLGPCPAFLFSAGEH